MAETYKTKCKATIPYDSNGTKLSFYTSSDTIYCPEADNLTDYVKSLVSEAATKIASSSALKGDSFAGLDVAYTIVDKEHNSKNSVSHLLETAWSTESPIATTTYPYLWKRTRNITTNSTGNKTYSTYTYEFVGSLGQNGIDGDSIEYIYYLCEEALDADALTKDNYAGTGINYTMEGTKSKTSSGEYEYVSNYQNNDFAPTSPRVWYDDPQNLTNVKRYQYIASRKKRNGVWGDFSKPTLWGYKASDGELGVAAAGIVIDLSNPSDYVPFESTDLGYTYLTTYKPTTDIIVYYQGDILTPSDYTLQILDANKNVICSLAGEYSGSNLSITLKQYLKKYTLAVTNASLQGTPHVLYVKVIFKTSTIEQEGVATFTLAELLPGADGKVTFYQLLMDASGFTSDKDGKNTSPSSLTVAVLKISNGTITATNLSSSLYIRSYVGIVDELSDKSNEDLVAFISENSLNLDILDYPETGTVGSVTNLDREALIKAIYKAKYLTNRIGEKFYKTYNTGESISFNQSELDSFISYIRFELVELLNKAEKIWDYDTLPKTKNGTTSLDIVFEGNSSTCIPVNYDGTFTPDNISDIVFTFSIYSEGSILNPSTFTDNKSENSTSTVNEGVFIYYNGKLLGSAADKTVTTEDNYFKVTIPKNTVITLFLTGSVALLNNALQVKAICLSGSSTISVIDTYTISKAISGKSGEEAYSLTLDNMLVFIDDESTDAIVLATTLNTVSLVKGNTEVSDWILEAKFTLSVDSSNSQIECPFKITINLDKHQLYLNRTNSEGSLTQGLFTITISGKLDDNVVASKVMSIYVKDITKGGKTYSIVTYPDSIGYSRDDDNICATTTEYVYAYVLEHLDISTTNVDSSKITYFGKGDRVDSSSIAEGNLYLQCTLLYEYVDGKKISDNTYSQNACFGDGSGTIDYDVNGYKFNLYLKTTGESDILLDSLTIQCIAEGKRGKEGKAGSSGYTLTCNNDLILLDDDTLDYTSIKEASLSTLSAYKGDEKLSGVNYTAEFITTTADSSIDLYLTPIIASGEFYLSQGSKSRTTKWVLGYYLIRVTATYEDSTFTKIITLYIKDFSAGETYNIITNPNNLVYKSDGSLKSGNNYCPQAFVQIIGGDLLDCEFIPADAADPRCSGKYSLVLSKSLETGYSVEVENFLGIENSMEDSYKYSPLELLAYWQYGYDYILFLGDTPLDVEHISCISDGADGASFEYTAIINNPLTVLNKNSNSSTVQTASLLSFKIMNSSGTEVTNCTFKLTKFSFVDTSGNEIQNYNELYLVKTGAPETKLKVGASNIGNSLCLNSNGSTLTEGSGYYQIEVVSNLGITVNTITAQFNVVAMGDTTASYKVVCTDSFYANTSTKNSSPTTKPTILALKVEDTTSTPVDLSCVDSSKFHIKLLTIQDNILSTYTISDSDITVTNKTIIINSLPFSSSGYTVNLHYGTSDAILDAGKINCNYDPVSLTTTGAGKFEVDVTNSTATFEYSCTYGEVKPSTVRFSFKGLLPDGKDAVYAASNPTAGTYTLTFTGNPVNATNNTKATNITIGSAVTISWANCPSVLVGFYDSDNGKFFSDTIVRTGFEGFYVGADSNGNSSVYSTDLKISSVTLTTNAVQSTVSAINSGNLILDSTFDTWDSENSKWLNNNGLLNPASNVYPKLEQSFGNILGVGASTSWLMPIPCQDLDSSQTYTISYYSFGEANLSFNNESSQTFSGTWNVYKIQQDGAYYDDIWEFENSTESSNYVLSETVWYKIVFTFTGVTKLTIGIGYLARPMLNIGSTPIGWTQYQGNLYSQILQTANAIKLEVENTSGVSKSDLNSAGIYLKNDGTSTITGEVLATLYNFITSTTKNDVLSTVDNIPYYYSAAGFITKELLLEKLLELITSGVITQTKYNTIKAELSSYANNTVLFVTYNTTEGSAGRGKEVTSYAAMTALGAVTNYIVLGYIFYYIPEDTFKWEGGPNKHYGYIYEPDLKYFQLDVPYSYKLKKGVHVYDKVTKTNFFTESPIVGSKKLAGNVDNYIIILGYSATEYFRVYYNGSSGTTAYLGYLWTNSHNYPVDLTIATPKYVLNSWSDGNLEWYKCNYTNGFTGLLGKITDGVFDYSDSYICQLNAQNLYRITTNSPGSTTWSDSLPSAYSYSENFLASSYCVDKADEYRTRMRLVVSNIANSFDGNVSTQISTRALIEGSLDYSNAESEIVGACGNLFIQEVPSDNSTVWNFKWFIQSSYSDNGPEDSDTLIANITVSKTDFSPTCTINSDYANEYDVTSSSNYIHLLVDYLKALNRDLVTLVEYISTIQSVLSVASIQTYGYLLSGATYSDSGFSGTITQYGDFISDSAFCGNSVNLGENIVLPRLNSTNLSGTYVNPLLFNGDFNLVCGGSITNYPEFYSSVAKNLFGFTGGDSLNTQYLAKLQKVQLRTESGTKDLEDVNPGKLIVVAPLQTGGGQDLYEYSEYNSWWKELYMHKYGLTLLTSTEGTTLPFGDILEISSGEFKFYFIPRIESSGFENNYDLRYITNSPQSPFPINIKYTWKDDYWSSDSSSTYFVNKDTDFSILN